MKHRIKGNIFSDTVYKKCIDMQKVDKGNTFVLLTASQIMSRNHSYNGLNQYIFIRVHTILDVLPSLYRLTGNDESRYILHILYRKFSRKCHQKDISHRNSLTLVHYHN